MSDVKFETVNAPRAVATPTVSSGGKGRSFADLVERFEKTDPDAVRKAGLSTAALRAGELIRAMRRRVGLSQAGLAKAIGVAQSRVSELEAGIGTQGPTWDVMERVAAACGTHLTPVLPFSEQERYIDEVYAKLTADGVSTEVVQFAKVGDQPCLAVKIPSADEANAKVSVILKAVAVCR